MSADLKAELIIDAVLVPELDRAAAEHLDRRIRLMANAINEHLGKLQELVGEAKRGEIHKALGFRSWTEYVADVFTVQVRLDREQRQELVGYLSGEGMSQRAIADVVGASVGTVNSDLSGVQNRTPEFEPKPSYKNCPENYCPDCGGPLGWKGGIRRCWPCARANDVTAVEQELPPLPENYMDVPGAVTNSMPGRTDGAAEPPINAPHQAVQPPELKPVTGLDGKTYKPKPVPKDPRRKPITDAFGRANYELRRSVERVVRLTDDDRFQKNKDQISGANLSDLIRARDALNGVIQQLEG